MGSGWYEETVGLDIAKLVVAQSLLRLDEGYRASFYSSVFYAFSMFSLMILKYWYRCHINGYVIITVNYSEEGNLLMT